MKNTKKQPTKQGHHTTKAMTKERIKFIRANKHLTNQEIAEQLNLTKGTVRSLTARYKIKLAKEPLSRFEKKVRALANAPVTQNQMSPAQMKFKTRDQQTRFKKRFIKENRGIMSCAQMAKQLGCTETALSVFASYHKISLRGPKQKDIATTIAPVKAPEITFTKKNESLNGHVANGHSQTGFEFKTIDADDIGANRSRNQFINALLKSITALPAGKAIELRKTEWKSPSKPHAIVKYYKKECAGIEVKSRKPFIYFVKN